MNQNTSSSQAEYNQVPTVWEEAAEKNAMPKNGVQAPIAPNKEVQLPPLQ